MKVLAVSSSKINLRGLNVAEVVNPGKCIGCRMCEIVCPDFAIAVIEERVVTNAHT
jgi:2-oxoglutarate ferredoxin oxidoreductase subunit delta